jgi:hypothetical protein
MIRVITWIDMDGPVLYEATRAADNPESWTLMRLDVHKQRDPDSVPGEVILDAVDLQEIYRIMTLLERTQRRQ